MSGRDEKIPALKLTVVQYVILGVFLVLSYGLWSLQVRKSDEYFTRAEQNRIRRVPVLAPRGKLLDRDGQLIVDNYPSFSALLLRDQGRDLNADAQKIADGLHISADEIREKVRRYALARKPSFEPIIIKDDITPDESAFIESHRDQLPELETLMVHRRLYPKNGFLAHLIGYVGEVSEEMLNSPKFEVYQRGDIVGQSGVELQYNDVLMGRDGSRRVIVDSHGREVGRPPDANVPAIPGQKLRLTIDLDVQKAAEQALEGKNGAVVAMDPRNGEILAMVSRPTFDPNDFAVRISAKEWNQLVTDPAHPLLNKAIQAQLAPGSVFKIIMSVAGTNEGIAQNLHVNCPGGGTFYGRYFKCWVVAEHRVHGAVDLSKGIYQSCDVFFYTLAERLGIEKIAKWATAMGLGKRTGIDLPNEVSGVMPSEEWKMKTFRQKWYAGEVISVGIGQGAVATTPIQLARAIGGIAMGGTLYRPHVVNPDQLPDQFKGLVNASTPDVTHVQVDPQSWITITDAMAGVVTPGLGTAPSAHLQGIDFAGKTGSAQIISNKLRESKGFSGKQYNDNGWFAGVAPRRNPEIVVCVLSEQGEHGYLAARVASQVIKAYVEKQRRLRNNPTLFSDKADPGSVPIAGMWTTTSPAEAEPQQTAAAQEEQPADEHLHGGTLLMKLAPTNLAKKVQPATVPGIGVVKGD
ncbi:MAG TPA: penicillin-binding protein 2 [Candidatus Limnocylindrales bacterium]|jgi:penicillin-binding protein 2|nr:penicillin-binding protein 2 [Candidatus Limnocylindrales bacterium]